MRIFALVVCLVWMPLAVAGNAGGGAKDTGAKPDWREVVAARGGFRMRFPAPPISMNPGQGASEIYMLGVKLRDGTFYFAMFAPKGSPKAEESYTNALADPSAKVSVFHGMKSVDVRRVLRGSDGDGVSLSRQFQGPRGTYALMVMAPIASEAVAAGRKDTFFDSFQLESEVRN